LWDSKRICRHGRSDSERLVLPTDERLEVVVNDRFGDAGNALAASEVKEDGVPPETLRHPGDRRLGAVRGARDLPVSRTGCQSRGHRDYGRDGAGAEEAFTGWPGLCAQATQATSASCP
jgi:hypothetical protein